MRKRLFTSEAVSEGHPDKICDLIADKIVDAYLEKDPNSHVACEVFITEEFVLVGGEITSFANDINIEKIVRNTLKEIGYTSSEIGIDPNTCKVNIRIRKQSIEINKAVDKGDIMETGAGDQGIVFGYASDETKNYMPLAYVMANDIMKLATKLRKEGEFEHARPDMKAQVTVDTNSNIVETILVSIQHDKDIDMKAFKSYIVENIINPVVKSYGFDTSTIDYLINPSGSFVVGGPKGDTGLTGRKLICDTYGGSAHNGGGAMSGKDATKVDRSAAFYARYMAKNLVAAGVAKRIEIELAYAIGMSKPISIGFLTFQSSKYSDDVISDIIAKVFDARVGAIITQFKLNESKIKYTEVSNYGAFGREDLNLPWEKLDKVNEIKKILEVEDIKSF